MSSALGPINSAPHPSVFSGHGESAAGKSSSDLPAEELDRCPAHGSSWQACKMYWRSTDSMTRRFDSEKKMCRQVTCYGVVGTGALFRVSTTRCRPRQLSQGRGSAEEAWS
ncbi:uncharacterized protein [Dermacentor albipictus]|uniref:uncharacterized protein isoform X1 n=1 Tax=Dermacentor albipictus TaxID=60249 RepID=UPI0038FCC81F